MTVFEEADGVQTTIEGCPCGNHHARTEYQDTQRAVVIGGRVHGVLRGPCGRHVYMDYGDLVFHEAGDTATVYAPITVNDVPALGTEGRTK